MENQNVEFFIKKIDSILKKFDYEGYNDIDDKYQDFLIENAQEIDALYQMCGLNESNDDPSGLIWRSYVKGKLGQTSKWDPTKIMMWVVGTIVTSVILVDVLSYIIVKIKLLTS
jgi:hypothetical protein